MSLLRALLAAIIGLSLAVLPVAGAMAGPVAAMAHCDKKDMGGCPGCDKSNPCPGSCAAQCIKAQAAFTILAQPFETCRPRFARLADDAAALPSWPPPAPPPRA